MSDVGEVYDRFAKAFAAIGSIRKASKNQHHGYAYRGIDDVMNALHGVLADHGLFYVPRLVGEAYESWETAKGKRLQVARMTYEFVFYAPDGSSLVVGPVVGQSADTDDKAPMQALSQAAKPALLNAFCIPTEDMSDGDSTSSVEAEGGRVAAAPGPVNDKPPPGKRIEQALAKAKVPAKAFTNYLGSQGFEKWSEVPPQTREAMADGIVDGVLLDDVKLCDDAASEKEKAS